MRNIYSVIKKTCCCYNDSGKALVRSEPKQRHIHELSSELIGNERWQTTCFIT